MPAPSLKFRDTAGGGINPAIVAIVCLTLITVVYLHKGGQNLQQVSNTKSSSSSIYSVTDHRPSITHVGGGQSGFQVWTPLGIPQGKAEALPSILTDVKEEEGDKGKKYAGIYGGKGDKAHLGGFTIYDGQGVSPGAWRWMIEEFGVKSMMDIGCGKGVSTFWFHLHGAKVLCLEGSHDAVSNSLLPDPTHQVVEHDFSRGPYWPEDTYDIVWSVEFLEHVGRNYQYNYLQAWRKAAYIFASHSLWGGWHHVEVHKPEWWIQRIESMGFKHSQYLTDIVRQRAKEEHYAARANPQNTTLQGPDGDPINAQHIWLTMQVFVNPAVASLPEHAHLMAETGCFKGRGDNNALYHQPCGLRAEETTMPPEFLPLKITPEQDEEWKTRMRRHIEEAKAKEAASKN